MSRAGTQKLLKWGRQKGARLVCWNKPDKKPVYLRRSASHTRTDEKKVMIKTMRGQRRTAETALCGAGSKPWRPYPNSYFHSNQNMHILIRLLNHMCGEGLHVKASTHAGSIAYLLKADRKQVGRSSGSGSLTQMHNKKALPWQQDEIAFLSPPPVHFML